MEHFLIQYVKKNFGFGNWHSPIWFIGPEERSNGANVEEIQQQLGLRLQAFNDRQQGVDDCRWWCNYLGITQWHRDQPPPQLQRTWARLIRVGWPVFRQEIQHRLAPGAGLNHNAVLPPLDEEPAIARQQIRHFQQHCWGSILADGHPETGLLCDISLLPLPLPNEGAWPYAGFLDVPWLVNQEAYLQELLPARIASLRARIAKYHPRKVVFYGAHMDWWQAIAHNNFVPTPCFYPNPATVLYKIQCPTG